jgi:8-oxo-dGTP pyrophosphatase MutT (NUDIX family)
VEETPAWSVVLVVFNGPEHVLALSRGFNTRDPSFPGGNAEPDDETPMQTAARELYEETGLKATELRCMDEWVGDKGQPVFAYFVPKWKGKRLRASDEGKPFWTQPRTLLAKNATFRDEAKRLLSKLGRVAA